MVSTFLSSASLAFDEQMGEEVERIEALPCRRCAEEAR
jgi:hypothetical protein